MNKDQQARAAEAILEGKQERNKAGGRRGHSARLKTGTVAWNVFPTPPRAACGLTQSQGSDLLGRTIRERTPQVGQGDLLGHPLG